MTSSARIQVKFYANKSPEPDAFIPVFHRFIRENVLDELAIDVADYGHVHEGPGVVLIGHAYDYYWDLGEGRPGLVYTRKREAPAPDARLTDAVRRYVSANLPPALHGVSIDIREGPISYAV